MVAEVSYNRILQFGYDPIHYRFDAFAALPDGSYSGVLDALVWAPRGRPALMALVRLDDEAVHDLFPGMDGGGLKVCLMAFQRHSRKDLPPYLGMRMLAPSDEVEFIVSTGVRGGRRAHLVLSAELYSNWSSLERLKHADPLDGDSGSWPSIAAFRAICPGLVDGVLQEFDPFSGDPFPDPDPFPFFFHSSSEESVASAIAQGAVWSR